MNANFGETSPLPPLRSNLDALELLPGIITLFDNSGIAETTVQLPLDVLDYLLYMDGKRTALDLARHATISGRPLDIERFLEVVSTLEEECFLDSPTYHNRSEEVVEAYNRSPVHYPFHAGSSYPVDPTELRSALNRILGKPDGDDRSPAPSGIIVPHIDPRVGAETYSAAWRQIRNSDADIFVILGVPHLVCYDRAMFSTKDFHTPLGRLRTDREFIAEVKRRLSFEMTSDEIAHRREHSIEFQTVFLKHLFGDREISIVPVLMGHLADYVESGQGGAGEDELLSEFYDTMVAVARDSGKKVCWIASVDFCHVGKKFGDPESAEERLDEIRIHDEQLIEAISGSEPERFLELLVENRNRNRVCGVAPMYALMRTGLFSGGTLLKYDQWMEEETESAVSFAAISMES